MRIPVIPKALAVLLLLPLVTGASAPAGADVDRWSPAGPEGGEIVALTVDSAGVWYAAGRRVLFRSTNGGRNWSPLPPIPFAYADPEVLAASGLRLWAAAHEGVLTSIDGGRSWRRVTPPSFVGSFYGHLMLAVSATAETRAFLVHSTGFDPPRVDVTTDGGETWRPVLEGLAVSNLVVAPSDGQVAYAAVAGEDFRLLVTRDGGLTWADLAPPEELDVDDLAKRIEILAVDPRDPNGLVVGTSNALSTSRDGGTTWSVLSRESGLHSLVIDPTDFQHWLMWGFGFGGCYGGQLTAENYFDKFRGALSYTVNGGSVWTVSPYLDVLHQVVWDPGRPGRVLAAASRVGILASDDGGRTWQPSNWGLKATSVCSLAVDPHRRGVVYGGAGVCSRFGGISSGDDGGYLKFDGSRWHRVNRGLRDPNLLLSAIGLVTDPTNSQILYALAGHRLARSRNGGRSWHSIYDTDVILTQLVVDPERPRRLFAGGWVPTGRFTTELVLIQSDDGGDRWRRIPIPPLRKARGALRRVHVVWQAEEDDENEGVEVFFDPHVDGRLIALYRRSVLVSRSKDDGRTWTKASEGLPRLSFVSQLVFDPERPGLVYVVMGEGVFVSDDLGDHWRPLTTAGLGRNRVDVLAINPADPAVLYAGTEGGGGFFVLTRSDR